MSSTTIPMSTSYKSVFVLSILMIFLFLIGVVESGSKSVGIGSWYWGYTAWKMYKRDNDSLVSLQKFILWLQVVLFPVALAVLLYSDSDVRRFVDVTPLYLIITATLNMGVTYFLYRFFKGQQHIDLNSASIVGNSSIEDPSPESKTSSWLDRSVPKNEDDIFDYIANELETNSTNKSLWYKLFAECDGDETRTKVAYINARSSQLSSEIAKAQEDLQEQERRIEMVRRAGNPVIQDKVLFRDDEVAPVLSGNIDTSDTDSKTSIEKESTLVEDRLPENGTSSVAGIVIPLLCLLFLTIFVLVPDQEDKGNYKDVKRGGVVETYYANGQLLDRGVINDGERVGLWESYHENGQLKSKGNYKNWKENGLWEWYDENGRLEKSENYKDGQRDGLWESYYENGQLKAKGNLKDGKYDGLWEGYYENGQLWERGTFKDGERDGSSEWYDENGQLELKSNFKDGKYDGLWEWYFENGQLKSKGNLKDGNEDGLWEWYDENGHLKEKGNYKDGKREGVWEGYDKNGQLVSKGNYKHGELDGLWEMYHENGQLEVKGNAKDGKEDGLQESYYENGQLEKRENYKDGERDGLSETYYENGQLQFKGNYKEGKQDGLWLFYDENGQLTQRANYKDGKPFLW